MVVPEDQDGKSDICESLQREITTPTKNTRHGGQETPKKQFIIVDMREFRSELPALIHKRGIDIEPLTITVCIYTICLYLLNINNLFLGGRLYFNTRNLRRKKKLIRSDSVLEFRKVVSTMCSNV